jgi:uncharacterized protein (DUF2141 family)
MYARYIIFSILFPILLVSCANKQSITGGDKDETPPTMIVEESSPINQLNFSGRSLHFTFDEFFNTDRPESQVLITPTLSKFPKFTIKKKTLTVTFDEEEVLKENTTYVIQFGESIKDITEKNPVENFRYVFSTGDIIDSLETSFYVSDALTGKAAENVLIMLHDNLEDSSLYKNKPLYIAKTNKSGRATISNIKAGQYRAYALEDQNLNYLFDAGENAGFVQDTINLPDSTLPQVIQFSVYVPHSELAISEKKRLNNNTMYLAWTRNPDTLSYRWLSEPKFLKEIVKGNEYYAFFIPGDSTPIFTYTAEDLIDTIYPLKLSAPKVEKDTLVRYTGGGKVKIIKDEPFRLKFSEPIISFDTHAPYFADTLFKKIHPDSVYIAEDSFDEIILRVDHDSIPSGKLTILPGALISIDSLTNDTIEIISEFTTDEDLGNFQIMLQNPEPGLQYLVKLQKRDELIEEQIHITQDSIITTQFGPLFPGDYNLKIILDSDKDGEWTPGNILLRNQPETVIHEPLEKLRPGWDVELSLDLQ